VVLRAADTNQVAHDLLPLKSRDELIRSFSCKLQSSILRRLASCAEDEDGAPVGVLLDQLRHHVVEALVENVFVAKLLSPAEHL